MSKEEILNKKHFDGIENKPLNEDNIFDAMDEYAKKVSIGFGKWCMEHGFIELTRHEYWSSDFDGRYTEEELFELYIKSIETL